MSESTELQRAIEALTKAVDGLVRKDVYVADQIGRDVVQAGIREDIADLKRSFEEDKAERKRQQERIETQRAADRRLVLTALVVPFLLLVIQLYVNSQAGK